MFLMIDRFAEQRLVIGDYANRYDDIENLTKEEWAVVDEAINLLRPFLTATMKFSKGTCSISEIIPTIKWLRNKIQTTQTALLTEMKQNLLQWLSKPEPQYFGKMEWNAVYSVATVLDPRFKTAFFSIPEARDEVITRLTDSVNRQSTNDPDNSEESLAQSKRPKLDEFSCNLDEVAEQSSSQTSAGDVDELQRYLLHPKLSVEDDPYEWWAKHDNSFPNLAHLARYYLATPASSVDDERVFSGAGKLLEPRRNRLQGKKASMLAFLYFNSAAVDFDYEWPKH